MFETFIGGLPCDDMMNLKDEIAGEFCQLVHDSTIRMRAIRACRMDHRVQQCVTCAIKAHACS